MVELGCLLREEAKNVAFLVQVGEIQHSHIELALRILFELCLDMQLSRHNMLVHDSLPLEVLIVHLRLIVLLAVIVVVLVIERVVFQVLTVLRLVLITVRVHVVTLVIVLAPNSVISVFIKVVAQWVVVTLVCLDVETIFVEGATLKRLNLFCCLLDAKNATTIFV